MVKTLAIIGGKKSGKTSLIVKLVGIFIDKGYRIGVIKNSYHHIITDKPGTDTWNYKEAGALRVFLNCPDGSSMPYFSTQEKEKPQYIAQLCMEDLDLVFLEGFKNSPLKKILLHGDESDLEFNPRGLIATIGDKEPKENLPNFDREDIEGIASFIESSFLKSKRKSDRKPDSRYTMDIEIRVDGKKIGLKGFVKDMVSSTISGMVTSLKGCDDPDKIEITIDLKKDSK